MAKHQQTVVFAVGGVAAVAIVVGLADYLLNRRGASASNELGAALAPLSRPVSAAKAEEGAAAPFATEAEKDEAVAKSLTEFRAKAPDSRAAHTAALSLGQVLLRQQKFAEAAPLFEEYLKHAPPDDLLRPSAFEGKGYALEGKGDLAEAMAAFDALAQSTKGDFLKGMGDYHKARLLVAQGKADEGAKLFAELSQKAPNTAAARMASDRLAVLIASGVKPPAPTMMAPAKDGG